MTDPYAPLRYRDGEGARHEVLVRRTSAGDWQVLDSCARETCVVDTLDGREDGPEQARALARDYLQTLGRPALGAGRTATESIPERRGADDHSDRRQRQRAREPRARAAALPRAAR
jgi:hypothetical protein